jgi:hypothetical protein
MHSHISYQAFSLTLVTITSLWNFITSFRSDSISLVKDVGFVSFLVVFDALQIFDWLKALTVLLPLSLLTLASFIVLWVFAVTHIRRKLFLWCQEGPGQEKCLLGRPLLFPTQLTHTRMFPEKYHYSIDYFLVGIPVGLRCRIGALMSIDSDGSGPRHLAPASFRSSIISLLQKFIWFGIDTNQYLHRGDGHLSLNQKLEHFLKERVSVTLAEGSGTDLTLISVFRVRIQPIILTHI